MKIRRAAVNNQKARLELLGIQPSHLAELLIHKLTVEAQRRADRSGLSRRELARRLSTSVPQLYRLLDPANTRKSLGQLIGLLHVLECEVQLVVSPRRAA
jgi:hypothetical protein